MSSTSDKNASASSQRMSRDEYKKQQMIEEARKNGLVMPEKDEQGRDINPHIPQYIKQAPWYLDRGVPSLDHQRYSEKQGESFENWYNRGAKLKVATTYRKGACKNCGSMSHPTKDCLERPRRKGAVVTNEDIVPDEVVQKITLKGFDAKRDRWNGYNPEVYAKEVVEPHHELEKERKKIKDRQLHEKMIEKQKKKQQEEELKKATGSTDGVDSKSKKDDDDSSSDDDYFSSSDSGDEDLEPTTKVNGKKDPKTTSISQSLRTREDVPKYLYNLDPDSAHYDPKTRSMRGNPLPLVDPSEAPYTGDNTNKKSGEYQEFIRAQKFLYDASRKGEDINLASVPSQAHMAFSNFESKKKELENARRKAVIEKYGGEKFVNKPQEFESAQTENYAEYSSSGRIIGGKQQAVPKSKYEEDVYYNGHTSVFGSYWDPKKGWGFKCCKQFDRKCYCTESSANLTSQSSMPKPLVQEARPEIIPSRVPNHYSSEEEEPKPKKQEYAFPIPQEKKRKQEEELSSQKKQKYSGSNGNYQVSEEDMEKYRRGRSHFEDPMKNYKND